MWKKHVISAAAASLTLGTGAAVSQNNDRPQQQQQREAEVQLSVPRNADGTINTRALLDAIRTNVANGVREIQFRDARLTQAEVDRLLLHADGNLAADIARLLPNDGIERSVRLRGGVEVRVQREPNGELRARFEDVNFGSLSAQQRAELAQQLAARFGFDRVRLRGVDANGERVRLEFRGDKVARADRREDRAERREDRRDDRREDRVARLDRPERGERVERPERVERAERPERAERVERPERDNSGRH